MQAHARTKIGTDLKTSKVKTSLLGVNILPPVHSFPHFVLPKHFRWSGPQNTCKY